MLSPNVPRGTLLTKIIPKRCGKKLTAHVELRWLAAVCQMTMFHVEQSIQNHFKVLWEKVWQMTVPRGTLAPNHPKALWDNEPIRSI